MAGRQNDLAARRLALGFTQESLAERLGVAPITIRRWETGDTKVGPRPYARHLLARHLQVTAEELEELLAEAVRRRAARAVGIMTVEASTPASTDYGEDASPGVPEREEPTERRDFLKFTLAGTALPGTLGHVVKDAAAEAMTFTRRSGATVVGPATFEHLEAVLVHIERAYYTDPLLDVFRMARAYRTQVDEIIRGPHTLRQGRELYAYAGWL